MWKDPAGEGSPHAAALLAHVQEKLLQELPVVLVSDLSGPATRTGADLPTGLAVCS